MFVSVKFYPLSVLKTTWSTTENDLIKNKSLKEKKNKME